MKNFIDGVVRANGEQWLGFIALLFVSAMLFLAAISAFKDHKIECQYLSVYQSDGITHYRIMNEVNWSADGNAFSSVNANETISLFGTMENKCPAK